MMRLLMPTCLFSALVLLASAHAQAPDYLWIKQFSELGPGGITADDVGNIYAATVFRGTVTIGDSTLTSLGSDALILKFDRNLDVVSFHQIRSTETIHAGLALDHQGNILITGSFSGTATLGDSVLTSTDLGIFSLEFFVAKFDADYNVLWAKQALGVPHPGATFFLNGGRDICADTAGNVIVTGLFNGTTTFDDTTLTAPGVDEIFTAKYAPDGRLLWIRQAGGNALSRSGVGNLVVDESGDIIVTSTFGGISSLGDTVLTSAGGDDILIVKYDGAGNLLWVRQVGGTGDDVSFEMVRDQSGSLLVAGSFTDTVVVAGNALVSEGGPDVLIAKYDGKGNALWARSAGSALPDFAQGITTDNSDNLFVTGTFFSGAAFGDTTLTSSGSRDGFVASYSTAGNLRWVLTFGGPEKDGGVRIITDRSNNLIVAGSFSGPATFGDTVLTSVGLADQVAFKLATGIQAGKAPATFHLSQNFPNPFNPETTIRYEVPVLSHVELTVYNVLGQRVRRLVSERQLPDVYTVRWDGKNDLGFDVASGVYFYQLRAGSFVGVKKLTLLR
ncbi:MAG: T9SS type A sorting domain-containing protein [Candidatus Krumholzibacteria bacterium]